MKARELIDKASFGPTTLRAIYQAFDDAWSEIAADYSREEASEARTRLAKALLSVENAGNSDAGTLKRLALEKMAQERSEIAPSQGTTPARRASRKNGGAGSRAT